MEGAAKEGVSLLAQLKDTPELFIFIVAVVALLLFAKLFKPVLQEYIRHKRSINEEKELKFKEETLETLEDADGRITENYSAIQSLENVITQLATNINGRFDSLHSTFQTYNDRIYALEQFNSVIQEKLADIFHKLSEDEADRKSLWDHMAERADKLHKPDLLTLQAIYKMQFRNETLSWLERVEGFILYLKAGGNHTAVEDGVVLIRERQRDWWHALAKDKSEIHEIESYNKQIDRIKECLR
jgi:chromosome segregation ATPase